MITGTVWGIAFLMAAGFVVGFGIGYWLGLNDEE